MPAPHAVLNVGEPDRWPVAIAHAVRIALTMTNVTEPAIRRVIQPIAQSVDLSCDKGYETKITCAKFRPAGAVERTTLVRVSLNTIIDRMRFPQHVRVAEGPRRPGHGQHGRGHGEEYRAHLGARGRGRRPEPRDEPADLGREQPPPREGGRSARLPSHRRASRHRKRDDVRKMFLRAGQELGPVDILVNNAGGSWDPRQDITKVDDAAWQGVLRAEIDGMFHTIRAALPHMRRRRWGRVVNIGMERSEEFTEP